MMTEIEQKWIKSDYLRMIPAFLIAGIIIYFSSLSKPLPTPPPEGLPIDLDINTILHLIEFAALAFFVAFGFNKKVDVKFLIIFTTIFAISDEIHQYFVPNRFFDIYDVIIDLIGVTIGFVSYFLLTSSLKKRKIKKRSSI